MGIHFTCHRDHSTVCASSAFAHHDEVELRWELEPVRGMIARGTLKEKAAIGVRIGEVVDLTSLDADKVSAEATLDGLDAIRTSVPAQRLPRTM
jgi:hypothetical protein